MKTGKSIVFFVLSGIAIIILVIHFAGPKEKPESAERSVVMAGVAPIAGLIESIAGDTIDVQVLVQPNQNPHVFEPSPGQMMSLSKASMLFTIGLPFEHQLVRKIAGVMPELFIIDLSEDLELLPSGDGGHHHTEHGIEHEHDQLDPHVWMSPRLVHKLVGIIAGALVSAFPEKGDFFLENLKQYNEELSDIDARIAKQLAPFKDRAFYVFHPSFGYFAHHYKLKQRAIEFEGKTPSPQNLVGLIEQFKSDGSAVIFIQPQFDDKSASAIARGIGGMTAVLDPLERDIKTNYLRIAEHLVTAFSLSLGCERQK